LQENDVTGIVIIFFAFHHGGGGGKTRIVEMVHTRLVSIAHIV
jgi:hypothetical protein